MIYPSDRYNLNFDVCAIIISVLLLLYLLFTGNLRVRRIRSCFRFALDDFGTGQANYSHIRELPFSIIKIDKSFLWAAEKDGTDRAVLKNMISLVRDLNLLTVAEGVETPEQRDHLVRDGVKYLQGYYYSRPVPPDQFLSCVRKFNAG